MNLGPTTLDTIGVPAPKKAQDAPAAPSAAEKQSAYAQQLADVPEFASYGPVFNSSTNPAQLTETETEYQVTCVKHIFKEHVVFQVFVDTLGDRESYDLFMTFTSSMYQIHSRTLCWNKFQS